MPSSRTLGPLLLACFSAAPGNGSSWIEQYATESTVANQACDAKDYAVCRQHLTTLLELLNGRADIVYRLAKVEAALGNRAAALGWLTTFSKMALPLAHADTEPAFVDLRGTAEFAAILAKIDAARRPISSSQPLITLPVKDLVAEDIAYDRPAESFYISSVRHGKIVRVARDGKTTDFLPEGAPDVWAVLALGVDSKRRYLWASTSAIPENLRFRAEDPGRSALLKFSLRDGTLVKRYDLPRDALHSLGDMTVSPGGDVFVSDSYGPVYWVPHDEDHLEVLAPAGTFRSPQTPALSADGHTLFVPDYSRGISAIDLASRRTQLLAHPRELSLAGIDGLYLSGRTMIAIQNGTSPARLIAMNLNSTLTRIENFVVLESNSAGLGVPTHGVVVGKRFYFIANSGWDQLAEDGQLKPGATFDSPVIRELDLHTIRLR
jgi:hypothetical protein